MENIKYASISKRGIAFFIDDLIVSLLFIIIFYNQISMLQSYDAIYQFIMGYSWVLLLIKVVYHTFFISFYGATIGKYLVKIKAVDEFNPNQTPSFQKSFLRAIVREIGEILFYITFIFAFNSPKNQTLHDKVTNIIVIDV